MRNQNGSVPSWFLIYYLSSNIYHLYKLFPFFHLHLVHILANQGRRIFFLAYQQHIVFLGYDKSIQAIQHSQLALGNLMTFLWQFSIITSLSMTTLSSSLFCIAS